MKLRGNAKRAGSPSGSTPPIARIVGGSAERLWGLSNTERLTRSFHRAGVTDCSVLDDECGDGKGVSLPSSGQIVLVRADHVFDERLIRDLVARQGTILVASHHQDGDHGKGGRAIPVAAHVDAVQAGRIVTLLRAGRLDPGDPDLAGLAVLGPGELASAYDQALRKRDEPYVLSLKDRTLPEIERRMFHGAYKGVTDFVTKWVWPVPAMAVTRWAAERRITPNLVTALSLVLVFLALWLFAAGYFLTGLLAAWIMTFLDTVDGKLARVTLTSTPAGNVFDHGIDLIHPPFWYAAWWYGLSWQDSTDWPAAYLDPALWIVLGGYVAGRLMEGLFLWLFRIEIHAWRPIDSAFRLVTARRNPNLVLLSVGALAGRPDLGFLAVAAWTILSLLFHGLRIVQALYRRRAGVPIRSWLSEPGARQSA